MPAATTRYPGDALSVKGDLTLEELTLMVHRKWPGVSTENIQIETDEHGLRITRCFNTPGDLTNDLKHLWKGT